MLLRIPLLLLLVTATPALAHDWYPIECCHGMDCAPVERVEMQDGATLVVTSKHGTGVVPQTMPRRESQDGKMHVCMRPSGAGMRIICVFLPPPT
jgi:formylmethanofuran dehydrogenase subunit D